MELWFVVVLCIFFLLVGFIFGTYFKRKTDTLALLVIDPVHPEINGGVYVVWDNDPHEMVKSRMIKDGQTIQMEVAVRDIIHESQQSQGT